MIRTRFAPSPTGELHIGGARTALFNFLCARSAGEEGRFILRIDDTDAERSRPEFEAALIDDLRWLGLDWDEGPGMPSSASFRQSERGALYRHEMDHLRAIGAVYPCFCSEERLAALRRDQLARGEPPRYDGRCRGLTPEEAARRIAGGERPCWRLALPDQDIAFDDLVRGRQSFPAGSIGDFVLERNDGTVTYLFASAVDDHLMDVTHVIRGDEHVPNTARQLAILDRMGWPRPAFAHIPMVLSPDRQKLSKRTGSTPIREYRERGFLPEALIAYLATLSWTPPEGAPMLDLSRLPTTFSLSTIVRSSPIHDEGHLLYWQRQAMERRGGAQLALDLAAATPTLRPFADRLAPLIEDMLEERPFLPDLRDALAFLTRPPEGERSPWMPALAAALAEAEDWSPEALKSALGAFMKDQGLKGREFFHPLRLFLTGADKGPALPLVLFAMGKEACCARLNGGP